MSAIEHPIISSEPESATYPEETRPWRRGSRGMSEDGISGFKEIVVSSEKLVMMYTKRAWQPPTDIYETNDEIVIRSEIAGVSSKDIVVTLDGDSLLIKGTRYEHDPRPKRLYRQMEINYGDFARTIALHGPINPQGIQAAYKNGFLEIIIPKAKKSKPITAHIEIKLDK